MVRARPVIALLACTGCWPLILDPRPGSTEDTDAVTDTPGIDSPADTPAIDSPADTVDSPDPVDTPAFDLLDTDIPDDLQDVQLRLIVVAELSYGMCGNRPTYGKAYAYLTQDRAHRWWDRWEGGDAACVADRAPNSHFPAAWTADPGLRLVLRSGTTDLPLYSASEVAAGGDAAEWGTPVDERVAFTNNAAFAKDGWVWDLVISGWPGQAEVVVEGVLAPTSARRFCPTGITSGEFELDVEVAPPWTAPYHLAWADPAAGGVLVMTASPHFSPPPAACAFEDNGSFDAFTDRRSQAEVNAWLGEGYAVGAPENEHVLVEVARGETTGQEIVLGGQRVSIEGVALQWAGTYYSRVLPE